MLLTSPWRSGHMPVTSVAPFTRVTVGNAAWLLVYGAAWAILQEDGLTGINMARGLRRVSDGDSVEVRAGGWVSVQQAFRDGRSINAAGASGPIDYDPDTEETAADIEVWEIQGGQISGIYPVSP